MDQNYCSENIYDRCVKDNFFFMFAVREHGGRGAAAQGAGNPVRAAVRGGGRHQRRPDLLPRPRRLHDRDLQLRQPPRRPACRRPRAGHGCLQARRRCRCQAAAPPPPELSRRSGSSAVRAVVDQDRRRHPRRRGGPHLVRVKLKRGRARSWSLVVIRRSCVRAFDE
jgi:hypothetical protein